MISKTINRRSTGVLAKLLIPLNLFFALNVISQESTPVYGDNSKARVYLKVNGINMYYEYISCSPAGLMQPIAYI